MKVDLITFVHAENGLAIRVIPETDVECQLLKGFWIHGVLETGHPHDRLIVWKLRQTHNVEKEELR